MDEKNPTTPEPISLGLEITVTRWPPAGGEPTVISGPVWHPVTIPGPGIYRDQPRHPVNGSRVCVRLADLKPAHPGWIAGTFELLDDYGAPLITPRPIVFYGHRSEMGTHVYCPQTAWGDASYSVGLRVASGGL